MSFSARHFHFIGICGTAMGAVASALRARGYTVTGSDQAVYPPMSDFLRAQGITITEGYRAENIPDEADVVVIGNAISRGNPECEAVLSSRRLYTSLPELLKQSFLRGRRNFVVTGTHGKTTTASLLAWLFEAGELNPSFMIGGVTANFGTGGRFTDSDFFVLEGDEYDTAFFDKRSKFVHYLPEVVILNNLEFDHADIYHNLGEIQYSFNQMLRLVPLNGRVLLNGDSPGAVEATKKNPRLKLVDCPAPITTVGTGEHNDVRITELTIEGGGTRFALNGDFFWVPLDGEFNVRNAAMTICAARLAGLGDDAIRAGLGGFKSVARRQQIRGVVNGVTIIDDFGHHPTAILQTAQALRARHLADTTGKLWVVFEPRSNSTRRKVFQDDLVTALAAGDGAIIARIAEIDKIPAEDRLDVEQLVADITARHGVPCFLEPDAASIVARLKDAVRPGDVIAVFSNGGFDGIHEKLLQGL